ncbi:hypothetical protein [Actinomadura sp. KC216]|uniref:hypothetical protein n=1 Tax=Actinomadura sp. KC216 TaxID=2530370 RepID=UPI0014043D08|nr:hypothetical protein [Actinomadura sp. KC216]
MTLASWLAFDRVFLRQVSQIRPRLDVKNLSALFLPHFAHGLYPLRVIVLPSDNERDVVPIKHPVTQVHTEDGELPRVNAIPLFIYEEDLGHFIQVATHQTLFSQIAMSSSRQIPSWNP